MIRTILSDALRLAADALDTHPAPERWEAELDALRQQIGDLDAAISDRSNATELIDRLCKSLDADGLYMAVELAERLQRRDSERDALDGEIDRARLGFGLPARGAEFGGVGCARHSPSRRGLVRPGGSRPMSTTLANNVGGVMAGPVGNKPRRPRG